MSRLSYINTMSKQVQDQQTSVRKKIRVAGNSLGLTREWTESWVSGYFED